MKNNNRMILALVLVLAIFHVPAFVIPFAHTAVFWIAYAATLAMFGLTFCAAFRAFRDGKKLESMILGWPVFKTAFVTLIVQMIVFFVFAALARLCPTWVAIAAEALILLAAVLFLLVRNTAEEVVKVAEQNIPERTAAIKALRAQANVLANDNPAMKPVAEALRFADPVSNESTAEIDAQIGEKLSSEIGENTVKEILALINRRKEICKAGK